MAKMMTDQGKSRDFCCPGHNPKELNHGTERAREKREWLREVQQEQDAADLVQADGHVHAKPLVLGSLP